jgi:hypothetical protein
LRSVWRSPRVHRGPGARVDAPGGAREPRILHRRGAFWQGLYTKQETDSPDSVAPSEETLRDEDIEPPEIDGHVLAKACRGKVNRLFRRMIGQCELAVERGRDSTTPIVRMAAVLGVVRHLRSRQATFAWLPKGERLVDQDREWDFFKEASRSLYAPACGLAAKALAEHDGREFDELTAVRGLLTWLALDRELDTRTALDDVGSAGISAHDSLLSARRARRSRSRAGGDRQARGSRTRRQAPPRSERSFWSRRDGVRTHRASAKARSCVMRASISSEPLT